MSNKTIAILATILGVVLVALAIYYFLTPADHLMPFIPGYSATDTSPHIKHGIASLFLGLGSFAFAWFMSGAKTSSEESKES